jgi:hypothetical protein
MIQMANTKEKQAPYGNPQLNIRLEKEILDQLKAAAEKEGMSAQDWARRAILTSLGQDIPGGIGRAEFEDAIAELRNEFANKLGDFRSEVTDTAITDGTMRSAIAPLKEEIEALKKQDGIE